MEWRVEPASQFVDFGFQPLFYEMNGEWRGADSSHNALIPILHSHSIHSYLNLLLKPFQKGSLLNNSNFKYLYPRPLEFIWIQFLKRFLFFYNTNSQVVNLLGWLDFLPVSIKNAHFFPFIFSSKLAKKPSQDFGLDGIFYFCILSWVPPSNSAKLASLFMQQDRYLTLTQLMFLTGRHYVLWRRCLGSKEVDNDDDVKMTRTTRVEQVKQWTNALRTCQFGWSHRWRWDEDETRWQDQCRHHIAIVTFSFHFDYDWLPIL